MCTTEAPAGVHRWILLQPVAMTSVLPCAWVRVWVVDAVRALLGSGVVFRCVGEVVPCTVSLWRDRGLQH